MSIKLQLPKLTDLKPRINVIGVGGAGCNAINNMISAGLVGVEFVVANTDAQALATSSAEHRLQLGVNLTEGLGAGSKPEIGEAAAEEAIEEIRSQIAGSHMVFIAAGMGGGTGTGAAAVIARAAKELGILVVGIVTKPFHFEGARRMRIAEVGIAEIRKHVDTLIVIPNQNLFRVANEKTTFAEAFVLADQVLYSGVACIVDLIIKEGLINLDFADVRTVMSGMGSAVMGTGEASGEGRASIAAEEAIANPLLDDVSLKGAKGLLLSITGGRDLTLYEVDEAASRVRQEVDPEANIIVGATFDETLGDRVRVSIVASGMARLSEQEQAPPPVDPRQRSMRPPAAPPIAIAASRNAARLSASAAACRRRRHAAPLERRDRREQRRRPTRSARATTARDVARARQRRHRGRLLAPDVDAAQRRARTGARVERQGARAVHSRSAGRPASRRAPHAGRRGLPAGRAARVPRQGRLRSARWVAAAGCQRRGAAPRNPPTHHGSRPPRGDGRSADEQRRSRSAAYIKLVVRRLVGG